MGDPQNRGGNSLFASVSKNVSRLPDSWNESVEPTGIISQVHFRPLLETSAFVSGGISEFLSDLAGGS